MSAAIEGARVTAKVLRWFGPFGFAAVPGEEREYMIHQSNIRAAKGEYRTCLPGETVTFIPRLGPKGWAGLDVVRLS